MLDLFSRSNYGFLEEIPVLQSYLKSLRYLEELQKFVDEGNTKLSKLLEPDQVGHIEPSLVTNGSRSLLGTPSEGNQTKTSLIDDSNIEVCCAAQYL